jgi:hypothetical protein
MTTEQQQMLADATKAVLDRRFNGSVNAAHKRLRVSRETITRMADGWAPDLPTVEKWANALKEDVNRWRRLCGYPEVLPSAGRERLIVRLLALKEQYPDRTIPVPLPLSGTADITPEEADRLADDLLSKLERGVL